MPIFLSRAVFALGLALSPLAASAQTAAAPDENVTRTAMGAWTLICAKTATTCIMEQVAKGPDGADLVKMQLARIAPQESTEGSVDTLFTVIAPLGVLLRAGVAIQVDGGKEIRGPFEACLRGGCVLQTGIPATMVAEMKKGVIAKVTVVAPPNKSLTADISLSGFTAAFSALKR
ncbi:MAG: invasion protein IalB [Paracoccaceae bacterium]|jgi:invasion protein IalB